MPKRRSTDFPVTNSITHFPCCLHHIVRVFNSIVHSTTRSRRSPRLITREMSRDASAHCDFLEAGVGRLRQKSQATWGASTKPASSEAGSSVGGQTTGISSMQDFHRTLWKDEIELLHDEIKKIRNNTTITDYGDPSLMSTRASFRNLWDQLSFESDVMSEDSGTSVSHMICKTKMIWPANQPLGLLHDKEERRSEPVPSATVEVSRQGIAC